MEEEPGRRSGEGTSPADSRRSERLEIIGDEVREMEAQRITVSAFIQLFCHLHLRGAKKYHPE